MVRLRKEVLIVKIKKELPREKKIQIIMRQQAKLLKAFAYVSSQTYETLLNNQTFRPNSYKKVEPDDNYEYLIFFNGHYSFNIVPEEFSSFKCSFLVPSIEDGLYNNTEVSIHFYKYMVLIKFKNSINLTYDYSYINQVGINNCFEFIDKITKDVRIQNIYSTIMIKVLSNQYLDIKNITFKNKHSKVIDLLNNIEMYEKLLDEQFIINEYDKSIMTKFKALLSMKKLNYARRFEEKVGIFSLRIEKRKRDYTSSEQEDNYIGVRFTLHRAWFWIYVDLNTPTYISGFLCYLIKNFSGGKHLMHEVNELLFEES